MTTRIALDPNVSDLDGESERLRTAGPFTEVELPGGIPCGPVTHHAEAHVLLTDPRLVKDINAWGAWQRGEIARAWALIGLANPGRFMLTVDGADTRRLRTLVAQALTPRRVERMRGRITQLTEGLLDRLPTDGSGVVDLKAEFAYPLAMYVIADLMGIEKSLLPRLKELVEKFFSTRTPPTEVVATLTELTQIMVDTVAAKQASPGDDPTSALIRASEDGDHLTDEEIISTLKVMVAAGHETTISLIVNTVVNSLSTPHRKFCSCREKRSGPRRSRKPSATPHRADVLIPFAAEDVPVGGGVIPADDALIVS